MPFRPPKGRNCSRKYQTRPLYVIQALALAEWRNPPRLTKNQRKVKSATWEDSSTPFHSARNDMSVGGSGLFTRVVIATPRNGTQAVPYGETRDVSPLRPLFLQCGTWYCPSSTAYGGPPSPAGKVLALSLCACCSYKVKRGTDPYPPPMAVRFPQKERLLGAEFKKSSRSVRNWAVE